MRARFEVNLGASVRTGPKTATSVSVQTTGNDYFWFECKSRTTSLLSSLTHLRASQSFEWTLVRSWQFQTGTSAEFVFHKLVFEFSSLADQSWVISLRESLNGLKWNFWYAVSKWFYRFQMLEDNRANMIVPRFYFKKFQTQINIWSTDSTSLRFLRAQIWIENLKQA
jgi:hypothetical protein